MGESELEAVEVEYVKFYQVNFCVDITISAILMPTLYYYY